MRRFFMAETIHADIRRMTEADKTEYFTMSKDFYSSGVTNSLIDDSGREKFWKEIISGEIVRAYIIGYGNKTAGYAVCCMSASQEACGRVLWLDELYIKPEFRGNGLGKAFFEFIENSDEYGYVRLEVEHDNKRALKLYQSLGYADANYLSLYKKTKAE